MNDASKFLDVSLKEVKKMFKTLEVQDKDLATKLLREYEKESKKILKFENNEIVESIINKLRG